MSGRKREYYPSYYRDKRRRERAVLFLSTVIVALIGIGLVVLAGVYMLRPRENLDQLAQRRSEIVGTGSSATASANISKQAASQLKEEQLLKPEDISEVGNSVPEMSLAPIQITGGEVVVDQSPPPQVTPKQSADGQAAEPSPSIPDDESSHPAKPKNEASPEKPKAEEAKPQPKPAENPKVKSGEKPSGPAQKPAPPQKQETKPSEPTYKFNVYAGVWNSETEANRQKSHLQEMGLQSSIIARSQGDGKSYLVAVGSSLENYDQAAALKNKLREAGFSGAYILRRET